jgi:hypothetical protein
MLAHQLGFPLPNEVASAIWNWENLRKECGSLAAPTTLPEDLLLRGVYFPRTAGQFRSTVTAESPSVGTRALTRKRSPFALG